MLDLNDATMARTRLLILICRTHPGYDFANKPYPPTLDGFTPELTLDPYSGVKFTLPRGSGRVFAVQREGAMVATTAGTPTAPTPNQIFAWNVPSSS